MLIRKLFLLQFIVCIYSLTAQQKITIDEIYNGTFRAKGMDELKSMKNVNQYTVLNFDNQTRSQQIELYDFASLKKVATVIDTKSFSELKDGIDSYSFSNPSPPIIICSI